MLRCAVLVTDGIQAREANQHISFIYDLNIIFILGALCNYNQDTGVITPRASIIASAGRFDIWKRSEKRNSECLPPGGI